MRLHLEQVLAQLDTLVDWTRRRRSARKSARDLDAAADLLARLGNPHYHFRSIHVTGTKGKGSTCALLEAALARAGYKTGRYSSPHVSSITERVTFNGAPISEDDLATALNDAWNVRVQAVADGTPGGAANWFDLLTVAAFQAFSRHGVNWAVVECGIGGRLDPTNLVRSDLAIITNVHLEHTDILGHTLAEIAAEKGGIIKEGSVLVTGVDADSEAGAALKALATGRHCRVRFVDVQRATTLQEKNLALAHAGLEELDRQQVLTRMGSRSLLDAEVVRKARLPGRMERVTVQRPGTQAPLHIVLDGAHVPFNLAAVLADLRRDPALSGPCTVVFGLGVDKDAEGMLEALRKHAALLICTACRSGPVVWEPQALQLWAIQKGIAALCVDEPRHAFARAVEHVLEDGWILVTGSLHLVGELRPR